MKMDVNYLISEMYDRFSIKILIFLRHGDKTPDNHITEECLKNITEKGMPGIIPEVTVLQHGSSCVRSEETANAASLWIINHGGKITKHLPKDARLGSDELFKELYPDEIKKLMKENGWKNYETLVNANPKGLEKFEHGVADAVQKIFSEMKRGEIALSVSHSPTVETAYNYFSQHDRDEKMEIPSLDGVILVEISPTEILSYR